MADRREKTTNKDGVKGVGDESFVFPQSLGTTLKSGKIEMFQVGCFTRQDIYHVVPRQFSHFWKICFSFQSLLNTCV